jgi:hypothetical protein
MSFPINKPDKKEDYIPFYSLEVQEHLPVQCAEPMKGNTGQLFSSRRRNVVGLLLNINKYGRIPSYMHHKKTENK